MSLSYLIYLMFIIIYEVRKKSYHRYILNPLAKWHLTYPLNLRQLEQLALARGVKIKLTDTSLTKATRRINYKKIEHPLLRPWVIQRHNIKLNRQWKFLYTVMSGKSVLDFVVLDQENLEAATNFFKTSLSENGIPVEINYYLQSICNVKRTTRNEQ
ncbi:hypothetical protein ACD661_03030 [Legionella lytica]|uniref:Transposase n=1 Tax=Legionella lytica TaxID=96232 RepID=A0ABW8D5N7_9GAMM